MADAILDLVFLRLAIEVGVEGPQESVLVLGVQVIQPGHERAVLLGRLEAELFPDVDPGPGPIDVHPVGHVDFPDPDIGDADRQIEPGTRLLQGDLKSLAFGYVLDERDEVVRIPLGIPLDRRSDRSPDERAILSHVAFIERAIRQFATSRRLASSWLACRSSGWVISIQVFWSNSSRVYPRRSQSF